MAAASFTLQGFVGTAAVLYDISWGPRQVDAVELCDVQAANAAAVQWNVLCNRPMYL
jgi:hypothetical protein